VEFEQGFDSELEPEHDSELEREFERSGAEPELEPSGARAEFKNDSEEDSSDSSDSSEAASQGICVNTPAMLWQDEASISPPNTHIASAGGGFVSRLTYHAWFVDFWTWRPVKGSIVYPVGKER
jgi:hypothetical protein